MKNSQLAQMLVFALMISVLLSAWFSLRYVTQLRKLQQLQLQVYAVGNQRTVLQSLYTDAVEYSKKNPDLQPILQTVTPGAHVAQPAVAPARPASKN